MARDIQKTNGITRLSEDQAAREVVRSQPSETTSGVGRKCKACDMYFSYLKANQPLCGTCDERFRTLYGNS